MNGTCAGGTGAFIDQMASLLATDVDGLGKLAEEATTIYPIASRCGVFAKSDIQPLLNDGAARSDVAASILQSVVNQTISGLACGKPIRGKVAFLGGPLHFLPQLRARFIETLGLTGDEIIVPEDGQVFVAMGAAFAGMENEPLSFEELIERLSTLSSVEVHEVERLPALFESEEELKSFRERHAKCVVPTAELSEHRGPVYIGFDAGSTTTKCLSLIHIFPDTPVLDAYMSEWGLKVENDLILDDGSFYGSVMNPFALYAENDITENLSTNASFVSPFSSSVTRIFDGKNDYSTFDLLISSDSAYAKTLDANTQITTYDKEEGDKTGQMAFGAGSSKLVNGHNTVVYSNMFVFGSLSMAGSDVMSITSFTNSDFFASVANSIRGEDDLITVAPKYIDAHPLTIQSMTEIMVMLVLLVVVIPVSYTHLDVYKRQQSHWRRKASL